jgi:hypothetical protein
MKDEWRRWRKREPYRFIHKPDTNPAKNAVEVEVFEQPPARFALMLGDCVYNIRAALDNLAYELAVAAHRGKPLPPKSADQSAFPIFTSRRKFRKQRKGKIGGMVPRAQATIQMLQPYRRWNKGTSDSLWIIDRLSNIDKHRLPHFQLMLPAGGIFDAASLGVLSRIEIEWESGPVKSGTVIARYVPVGDVPHSEMDVYFSPLLTIGFGDSLPIVEHKLAFILLPRLINYVEDAVFGVLRPYLT